MECGQCDRNIINQLVDRNITSDVAPTVFNEVRAVLDGDRRLPDSPCGARLEDCPRYNAIEAIVELVIKQA